MSHKILISQLRKVSEQRPKKYFEEVINAGRVEGGVLHLEDDVYQTLREKFQSRRRLSKLSIFRKATNAIQASSRVASAIVNRKTITASTEVTEQRIIICKSCEFFNGKACQKCGCIITWKTKLATEKCPVEKW